MKKPPKKTAADLKHPSSNEYVAWNGDVRKKRSTDRWNGAPEMEDKGFTSRGVTSSSSNYQPTRREIVNGEIKFVDPKTKEQTGRSLQKPPTSLAVGGHGRGRHVPERNAPSHYSPGYQRPRGAPATAPLTLRKEGADGSAA